jgi:O-antigen ligase
VKSGLSITNNGQLGLAIWLTLALLVGVWIANTIGSGNSSIGLISIAFILLLVVAVLPDQSWAQFLVVVFTAPGFLALGSGDISGLNIETAIVVLLVFSVMFRLFVERRRLASTDILLPFSLFAAFQFLSYVLGILDSTQQGFSFERDASTLRSLIGPLCLYLYVVLAELDEVAMRKLWNALVWVCTISAVLLSLRFFSTLLLDSELEWHAVQTKNLDLGFFGIAPIVYLLPLNLVVSRIVHSHDSKTNKKLLAAIGFVLLFATLFELQRAMIICLLVSLLAWVFILGTGRKRISIMVAGIVLIGLIAISPVGPLMLQIFDETTNASEYNSATQVGNMNLYTSGRMETQWPLALAYWSESPIIGIGYGQMNMRRWFGLNPIKGGLTAHSVYLGWLAESGLIGLGIGLWFFYRVTKSIRRARKSSFSNGITSEILDGLWVFWLAFLVNAIFNEFFWVTTWLFGFMMVLGACLSLISRRAYKGVEVNNDRLGRTNGARRLLLSPRR